MHYSIVQKLKKLDFVILFLLACFMVISTIVVYSATSGTKLDGLHSDNIKMYVLSFVVLFLAAFFNYKLLLRYFAYVLYAIGVGLLLYVLLKGVNINNSVRWIAVGGQQFQPSELVKIFTVLLLAKLLAGRQGEPLRLRNDLLPAGLVTALPVVLIMKQPDLGTALVFVAVLIGMLWMANVRLIHILLGAAVITIAVGLVVWLYYYDFALFSKIIRPHQLRRIETFLNPAADPQQSWHVLNSIGAISVGQLAGKGLLQGDFVQNGFIPYHYSDSIFVVIGEEFGFVGSAVLLLCYFLFIYRMIRIALSCSDLSGAYIVIGIVSMFTLQVFENIAMHIGLLPLTGISLPFISYGGSSLLTYMIAIGLVINVKIHADEPVLPE
ncbi:FtsW/RodA/SpoVE family cell cycle protein [Paenibacillus sp. J2TS4]|uniref:FtsW/RodA/SpoVE family cell cycle protein n=1 Tax=Paenibacillus sp. J2TS4 TaxID=2807194 RepID=UPI001B2C9E8B|nr:FtsW/RodA/SpoVE family cell cycle protein [Paenibacillus sp. J2TS4]GIP31480.1 rod shape-determining protein RodA [Paenibacillus sp. J2TS4]